ncbi:hypothetical protein ABEB36_004072 [Hypothenemus hampei]|uniref:Uncharacterized protein n=1 Tax=Hypothenemus hampei TaxID=57062 RepID=A0ABD1F227_HYPHA
MEKLAGQRQEVKTRDEIHHDTKQHAKEKQQKYKTHYDKRRYEGVNYEIGDIVVIRRHPITCYTQMKLYRNHGEDQNTDLSEENDFECQEYPDIEVVEEEENHSGEKDWISEEEGESSEVEAPSRETCRQRVPRRNQKPSYLEDYVCGTNILQDGRML